MKTPPVPYSVRAANIRASLDLKKDVGRLRRAAPRDGLTKMNSAEVKGVLDMVAPQLLYIIHVAIRNAIGKHPIPVEVFDPDAKDPYDNKEMRGKYGDMFWR